MDNSDDKNEIFSLGITLLEIGLSQIMEDNNHKDDYKNKNAYETYLEEKLKTLKEKLEKLEFINY